jgi:epoxyqueuosine reductase
VATFAEQIKEHARTIGFDKIGIVSAEALTDEGKRLREWLGRGFHGEMAWMEREPEKRSDPRLLVPNSRSVIVVAQNYFTDHEHAKTSGSGKISRYAWGDDYHDVVTGKLKALLAWIKSERPDADGKICVDTAPMMDKAWAVRAGLGWLGKHSNVIATEFGSWFFIGELILDIELDYESGRIDDHCGTCTACIDACPTRAIVEPYVVDSRLCLSYATIELRAEELPATIAENLEGWIDGCDICQDVCPWNRFETPSDERRFEPRLDETSLDLAAIEAMDHDEYVEIRRVDRHSRSGQKRNSRRKRRSAN